jgi:hypothetical protein
MTNPTPIRQQIDRELDRLSPEALTQILTVIRSLSTQRDYTSLWEQWFTEVDQLPRDHQTRQNIAQVPDYTDHLVQKYRDQGLNL